MKNAHEGKAITVNDTFSRETSVSVNIFAEAKTVWKLLTSASEYPRWNSTVISIQGEIKEGGMIELKSTLDEKRVFNLKIKEFDPEKRLVWGDNMGNRVYTIENSKEHGIVFRMTEKIGGLLFPLFARFIPSFDDSFEKFAADLKKEAESIQNSKN